MDFAVARALRIYPALIVANVLVVAGFFLTTLPLGEYFSSLQSLRYLVVNSALLEVQYRLPGVFVGNPWDTVNGVLWTLPIEMRM